MFAYELQKENSLINHLSENESDLFAHYVSPDGDISEMGIRVRIKDLSNFSCFFGNTYITFRDNLNNTLFEVSDSTIVFVNEFELSLERQDIRDLLYQNGIKIA